MSFHEERNLVEGSGTDDVGPFTIVGIYSTRTLRMGLKKIYRAGTGNRSENLGHIVTIHLKWNSNTNQFEGKWYVQTNVYHGENRCELKFNSTRGIIESDV